MFAIMLMVLSCSVFVSESDASTVSGTVSSGGITVSYVDSTSPVEIGGSMTEVGIMTITFASDPDDGLLTVSIDGKKSAPMELRGLVLQFLVDRLDVGDHAVTVEGDTRSWSVTLTNVIAASSIQLGCSTLSLNVGDIAIITASVSPSDVTDPSVAWYSTNPSVATVDRSGTVTAVSAGTATIIATCGTVSSSCLVTVVEPQAPPIHTHEWGSGVVTGHPSCTEPGVRTFTCSCGDIKTEPISPTGHQWSQWSVVEESTVDKEGTKERTCSVCGEKDQEPIPKKTAEDDDNDSDMTTYLYVVAGAVAVLAVVAGLFYMRGRN